MPTPVKGVPVLTREERETLRSYGERAAEAGVGLRSLVRAPPRRDAAGASRPGRRPPQRIS
ncbi:hypothetical protein [Streptomyces exfoliatus]|uniref:hypothetical protein n=1 Tax=Streptomyces exfoliatus TaxID=1905 RepID=UPI00379119EC